ncbi:Pentulose kinase [Mycena sanguinolenta]|uniref:Pentulose kinase n=1 Tax=Mycena sanguinolenta TaxID=230812 RepID=A0A8H6YBA8_9AGAR|nr:Pentulose kinase [Mycena sanguinolenta]
MSDSYYLGIDVGTGSARASLVSATGKVVASSTVDTKTWRDPDDHRIFEQSTDNIWASICECVKTCLAQSGIAPEAVKGVGFDATCSLAVCDADGAPVQVTRGAGLGEHGERNIVLWADHRAEREAEVINKSGSVVLEYVGGTMSVRFIPLSSSRNGDPQNPLAQNAHAPPPSSRAANSSTSPDFLTYRATGDTARSCCSLTCKCSYVPHKAGWQDEFFEKVGLGEMVKEGYRAIGAGRVAGAGHGGGGGESAVLSPVLTAGQPVGRGLSKKAGEEFGGLREGTPVGSGVIDAYAGWLGTVAARCVGEEEKEPSLDESRHRLAAVAGTSTCHLVQSPEGVFVPGVWGPYKDPVFRGWWMNEGGQSSTGQLIDFMLTTHPAYAELQSRAKAQGTNIFAVLTSLLESLRVSADVATLTELTLDLHLYPDLHGNRSPIADPRMRGALTGLTLDSSINDLARKYLATLQAIALQTRHIVDTLNEAGHEVREVYVSGGQATNRGLIQLLADACGVPVVLPVDYGGAVVRGAAVLGRFAAEVARAQKEGDGGMGEREQDEMLWRIMVEMTPPGTRVSPAASAKEKKLLEAKYKIFRESIEIQKRWRDEMEEAAK